MDVIDILMAKMLSGNGVDPEQISSAVTDWLEENVDPVGSAVVVDSTLSIEGAAADAKATGERISAVESVVDSITESIASKNVFDDSELKNKSGVSFSNGVYTGTAANLKTNLMLNAFDADKQYTISFYAYTDGNASTDSNGLAVGFEYTDGTLDRLYVPNSTAAFTKFYKTSNVAKSVKSIVISYASSNSNIRHLKEIQVESGNEATAYVPPSSEKTAVDEVARSALDSLDSRVDDLENAQVEIDPTLTISGAAADAKVTGERLSAIKSLPWYSAFEKEPLRIAYSAIWIDKINTVTHWLLASDMGFNALKGDVEITSDGKLIMCHDPGFTFDSDGRIIAYDSENNTPIVQMTYAECRSKFYADNPARYGGYCPVADVDDFIKICKEKGKICFVTIRNTNTADVVDVLADKIRYYGMESRTIINALSASLLEIVRANRKCDDIAINLVTPYGVPITNANVDSCIALGKCFLNIWNSGTSTAVIDSSSEAIAYAKSKDVPLLGLAHAIEIWNYLIGKGIWGAQVYKPIFDVEPKNYRFRILVNSGAASFGNLFASDRFSGNVVLNGTKLTVSDVCITGSFANVIDGIQPIKMNMLNPVIRCIDSDGNTIPCVWKNNALEISLSNANDNIYIVLVEV